MRILVILGSPRRTGFSAEIAKIAHERAAALGAEAETLVLAEHAVLDCLGCFTCLRTGACPLADDMPALLGKMKAADGFVVVSGVRNESVCALYKRFYERITYTLGFPLLLEDKHTLAISSVGFMGGKTVSRRLLGLQDVCHTRLSGHLHFTTGIPTRPADAKIRARVDAAVARLVRDVGRKAGRNPFDALSFATDRFIMRNFVFKKHPDDYAAVVRSWRAKGHM